MSRCAASEKSADASVGRRWHKSLPRPVTVVLKRIRVYGVSSMIDDPR